MKIKSSTIIYKQKSISDLSKEEISSLKRLCFRDGEMLPKFRELLSQKKNTARIFIAKHHNEIIGWCLYFTGRMEGSHIGTNHAYFYVKKAYRRNGIGSKLLRKLKQFRPNTQVYRWDYKSYIFFKSCQVKATDY